MVFFCIWRPHRTSLSTLSFFRFFFIIFFVILLFVVFAFVILSLSPSFTLIYNLPIQPGLYFRSYVFFFFVFFFNMKATVLAYFFTFALVTDTVAAGRVVLPKQVFIGTAVDPQSISTRGGFLSTEPVAMTSSYESAKEIALKERDAIKASDAYVYVINTGLLGDHLQDIHSTFSRTGGPKRIYKDQWTSDIGIRTSYLVKVDVLKSNGRKVIVLPKDMSKQEPNHLSLSSPYYGQRLVWPLGSTSQTENGVGSSSGHVGIQIE